MTKEMLFFPNKVMYHSMDLYKSAPCEVVCNTADPTGICRQFNGITEEARQL